MDESATGPVGLVTEERVAKIIRTLAEAGAIPADSVRPADLVTFPVSPR